MYAVTRMTIEFRSIFRGAIPVPADCQELNGEKLDGILLSACPGAQEVNEKKGSIVAWHV